MTSGSILAGRKQFRTRYAVQTLSNKIIVLTRGAVGLARLSWPVIMLQKVQIQCQPSQCKSKKVNAPVHLHAYCTLTVNLTIPSIRLSPRLMLSYIPYKYHISSSLSQIWVTYLSSYQSNTVHKISRVREMRHLTCTVAIYSLKRY